MGKLQSPVKTHSTAYVAHCVEALKNSGARITKPRLAVLECLAVAGQSLSPKDLMQALHAGKKQPDIDLATVYRILETLTELGLVHRVGPQGGFVACGHLGCDVDMHVVTHCLGCDKTQEVDLPPDILQAMTIYIRSATRFKPTDHFIQMNGMCPDCGVRSKSAKGP